MLTQNNLMDIVSTSTCSSIASNSYNIPSIKAETAESPSSQADYDNNSPKSDILNNAPVVSPISAVAASVSFNTAPQSPAALATIPTSSDTQGRCPSSQMMSASEAAAAIVSLTTAPRPQTSRGGSLFDAQVPVDINTVFGKFFGEVNSPPLSSAERKDSPSPPSEPQISGVPLDTAAFLQLSHLLAAQQQQHQNQQSNGTARSPDQEQKASMEQRSRGNASNVRHDSVSSNGGNDRRKSYPYTFQYCVLCQKNVHSSKLPCHIRQCHVGKPMFQCPACDFTSTYSKNNVKSHMVSLHGLAGDPINYMDQYAGQVEEFMKKCFPNVRGRGRPVHGRLSPSHNHPMRGTATGAQTLGVNTLNRRNSSPFTVAQINNLRLKSETGDNELNNKRAQPQNNRLNVNRQQQHDMNQLTPQNMPNGVASVAGNAALLAQQTARFNEIYAMAMLGNKASLNEKFLPLLNNNKNEFPLQHLNPLIYLQHLSQINAKCQNNLFPSKLDEEQEKPIGEEYVNGGMEQILSNIHKNLEHNNANHYGLNQTKSGTKRAHSDDDFHEPSQRFNQQQSGHEKETKYSACYGSEFGEPRYFPQSLKWTVVDGESLENTVFRTFTNSSELIEKFDLTPFEALLGQNNSLLTEKQAQTIREVREKIGLKSFEIMFAVHRLDLHVLTPENVRLVLDITPADVDIRRFAAYEQHNSVSGLSDDEQFILQLSKIDRLKEKLLAMNFMGSFPERLARLNQDISDISAAAKTLETSAEFHTILHLLLACGNLISGDFNAQLVEGFRASCILDMCEFSFDIEPSVAEDSSKKANNITLLDILAERIVKCFMHLSQFCEQCKIVDKASKINISSLVRQIDHFERGVQLLESELLNSGSNHLISNFIAHCELEIAQAQEAMRTAKQQLTEMLQFFGETPSIHGNNDELADASNFFSSISEFSKRLGLAITRVTSMDNTSGLSSPVTNNDTLFSV